jgi:tRNA 2-thiocytidine biosynthesis protein TtcA
MTPTRRASLLERKLLTTVLRTVHDFSLIAPGDRVLCGLSGGKDSYGMIWLLREVQRRAGIPFEIIAVNLDQGHPGFEQHVISDWCDAHGIRHHMVQRDTFRIVQEKVPAGQTPCSLCSRLRRGILYDVAVELGCAKIALGHHRDDALETLLMNLLHQGRLQAMPPRFRSDDGRNVVIRPLVQCDEADLAALALERAFPILPCDLCGALPNSERQRVKRLIAEWSAADPRVRDSMGAALANVRVTHLHDKRLMELSGGEAASDGTVP